MCPDLLSRSLSAIRLKDAVFIDIETADAQMPPRDHLSTLTATDHSVAYYLVTAGGCSVSFADEVVELRPGDIVVFPHGDAHVLSRPSRFAGAPAPIVCGFLTCYGRPSDALYAALPRMMHLRASSSSSAPGWLTDLVQSSIKAWRGRHCDGSDAFVRLSELMLTETVRCYVGSENKGPDRLFAGLADRHLSVALTAMHDEPGRDWTLESMARTAGLSRTVFAERFSQLVGRPPMHYLADRRMQRATGLLAEGRESIAVIASLVGYQSAPAFSRAFRRFAGMPPAEWRDSQRGPSVPNSTSLNARETTLSLLAA